MSEQARYVFPTPVGPTMRTFRCSPIHCPVASCFSRALSSPLGCRRSTFSAPADCFILAALRRPLNFRLSRSVSSASTSKPRRSSRLPGASRKNRRAVVSSHLMVSLVQLRLMTMSFDDRTLEIVGDYEFRHTTEELKGSDVGSYPRLNLLAPAGLHICAHA